MIIQGLQYVLKALEKYRWWIFICIYALGMIIYWLGCKYDFLVSLYNTAQLFTLNIHTEGIKGTDGCITALYLVGLFAAFYTIMSLISFISKKYLDDKYILLTQKKPYILVCGLGTKASAYIDSELLCDKNHILVIDIDANNRTL